MVILFVFLLLIALWGVKIRSFSNGYIGMHSTNAVKGIFAVIILYSHMRGYISLSDSVWDKTYLIALNYIGQLMVAMFLFYSVYGIMQSVKSKPKYQDTFFKKRILKTLYHFDFAVLLFLILSLVLGTQYDASAYITCWFGWESIGNSNWFIFDILALYIICFISFPIGNKFLKCYSGRKWGGFCICITILCVFLWGFLYQLKDGNWWIDTIFTFPLGMWYSLLKDKIEHRMKSPKFYYSIFIFLFVIFLVWHYMKGVDKIGICSCLFCLLMVMLSMKVKFDNIILQWLGTHAFSIYILQRLPMMLFEHAGLNQNIFLYVSLTIPSVLLLSFLYNQFLRRIDKLFL